MHEQLITSNTQELDSVVRTPDASVYIGDTALQHTVESEINTELDDIFASFEEACEDIDIEEQALKAFDSIWAFETSDEDERPRTVQDIKNDIQTFLSNPEIVEMQRVMDQIAMKAEQFCNHNGISTEDLGMGESLDKDNELSDNKERDDEDGHDEGCRAKEGKKCICEKVGR